MTQSLEKFSFNFYNFEKGQMNREDWLTKATDELRGYFTKQGFEIPKVIKISCGFPSSGGLKNSGKTLGEFWGEKTTITPQIFISPLLTNREEVLGVLVHELLHSCLADGVGHKKPFKQGCEKLGLEGPVTSTTVGVELGKVLATVLVNEEYPQVPLKPVLKEKKQTVRMKKISCESVEHEEPVILRGSKKVLDQGLPTCYCGNEFSIVEDKEEL